MHRSKLFRALVIGGGVTAASLLACGDEPGTTPNNQDTSQSSTSDSEESSTNTGETTDTTDTTQSTETETEETTETTDTTDDPLTPCFCNQEDCCEEVDGEAVPMEGFECCWGTSC